MEKTIKLRITPAIQYELEEPMSEAVKNKEVSTNINKQSDLTYLKIHSAIEKSKGVKTIMVSFNKDDIKELKSRIENEIGCSGICTENISSISDFSERAYWMGRKRAYHALSNQISKHEVAL